MKFEILEQLPNVEEYIQLRNSVGWGTHEQSLIEHSLPKSLYCVCALANNEIVGMARIIGDDGLVYYVQDVIVKPEYQGQGIGTSLMDRIMAYIHRHASQNSFIGLMAAKGKEPFYERYGFINRPTDRLGSGMSMVWKSPRPVWGESNHIPKTGRGSTKKRSLNISI